MTPAPVDHEALLRGERVRRATPALPAYADAAFRLGGPQAVRVAKGEYVCPACDGTGSGDERTGRITSTGARQCGACHGHGRVRSRSRRSPATRVW